MEKEGRKGTVDLISLAGGKGAFSYPEGEGSIFSTTRKGGAASSEKEESRQFYREGPSTYTLILRESQLCSLFAVDRVNDGKKGSV